MVVVVGLVVTACAVVRMTCPMILHSISKLLILSFSQSVMMMTMVEGSLFGPVVLVGRRTVGKGSLVMMLMQIIT